MNAQKIGSWNTYERLSQNPLHLIDILEKTTSDQQNPINALLRHIL